MVYGLGRWYSGILSLCCRVVVMLMSVIMVFVVAMFAAGVAVVIVMIRMLMRRIGARRLMRCRHCHQLLQDSLVDQIGFGQQQLVGKADLALCFLVCIELLHRMACINHCHHRVVFAGDYFVPAHPVCRKRAWRAQISTASTLMRAVRR